MLHHNWTYISLIFSEGSYGENGGKQVERRTRKSSICIGYSTMISSDANSGDMSRVIYGLRNAKARAVVLFMEGNHMQMLLNHPELTSGPHAEFMFLASDTAVDLHLGQAFDGGVIIFFPFKHDPDFLRTASAMTPLEYPDNSWFMETWQHTHQCLYKDNRKRNYYKPENASLAQECSDLEHLPLPDASPSTWVSTSFDGVKAVAYALDILIQENCSHLVHDKPELRECVRRNDLLTIIKNNTFNGTSWPVAFDELGDVKGRYQFWQYYSSR